MGIIRQVLHIIYGNGPGYPSAFVALSIGSLYDDECGLQYLATVFYTALKLVANYKIALVGGLLLAFIPMLCPCCHLYTEAFTTLLVSLFIYVITLYYIKPKTKLIMLAGLVLGYLVLTKILSATLSSLPCGMLVSVMFKRTVCLSQINKGVDSIAVCVHIWLILII